MKKHPTRITVILYLACAVIWTIKVILNIIYQTYNVSVFWFALDILVAIIWTAAFVKWRKAYCSNKDER